MSNQISVILHWNLDYAEFPRSEADNIVKSSYVPMINELEKNELGTVLCNITGHTIEYLIKSYPEVISKLQVLIDQNKIELLGSAYSHPILPLIPRNRRLAQLKNHKNLIKDTFSVSPTGIWPPELAISPNIVDEIKKEGFEWIVADHEHLYLSQSYFNELDPFTKRDQSITEALVSAYWAKWYQIPYRYIKAFRYANRWIDRLQNPFIKVENMGETVNILLSSVAWTNITILALQGTPPFFNPRNLQKRIIQSPLPIIPLYASDIEFFGYRSHTGNAPTPQEFVKYLRLLQDHNITLTSPSVHQTMFKEEPVNLTAGSWAPDKSLKIWTDSEDNRELIRRMAEIYQTLPEPYDEKIIQLMRIVENSDARGWSPINERKTEAYNAINELYRYLG